jgi:hypothetical protein
MVKSVKSVKAVTDNSVKSPNREYLQQRTGCIDLGRRGLGPGSS